MGLIEIFAGKLVFIDTAPLIYFIEDKNSYRKILTEFMAHVEAGDVILVSSTLTLMEVLVQPLRMNRHDIVKSYEEIMTRSQSLQLVEFDIFGARKAAEIRAKYNFKTPDAIQMAIALLSKADIFLTNDKKLVISEIQSITLDELINK
jgi:predicted nucleic acid-binding protein